MPSKFYKQAGEKLRCFKIKFKNYMNFGMNNEQIKHYMPDWRSKQSDKLIINKMIKHIVDDKIENVKLKLKGDFDSPFYIVSLIDDSTYVDTLDDFIESCEKFKLSYRIYKQEKDGVNLPLFFHKLLNTLNKPIRFIPIDTVIKNKPEMMYINNMDLITYNANTIYSLSKCYDPRILKMVNNTYFLDNNQVVLDFLSIWAEYNKKAFIKENKQHKSFEYSFNITNAVNKLRCFWLPKQNLKTLDEYNNYLGLRKEIKHTTSQLEQCGKKPNIDDDLEPVKAHMYGSKRGANSRDIYSKQFITFF
jgi:hypothetical protein